ncbi:MAG: DUF2059 domain-containing protein [Gemmatimonadota bacterium]
MLRLTRLAGLMGLGMVLATPLAAQQAPGDSTKLAVVRELLRTSHAAEQILAGIENALDAQKKASPQVPEAFWTEFVERAKSSVSELVEMLVPVYDREFTIEDLRGLMVFYQSPLGRKMLEAQPRITRDAMIAGQRWGAKLGSEVARDLTDRGLLPQ